MHKGDKPTTLAAYEKALTAAGWKSTGTLDARTVMFERNGKKLELDIYDLENTGVILTLK